MLSVILKHQSVSVLFKKIEIAKGMGYEMNGEVSEKKNKDGYYKVAYDQAIMLPLLEMAAERAVYIPEVMHVYNRINPLNVDKTKQQEQFETAQEVRAKKPYQRLEL